MTHPSYGTKYICYQCQMKFYDLKKNEPICPRCKFDQRKTPKRSAKRAQGASSRIDARNNKEAQKDQADELDDMFNVDDDADYKEGREREESDDNYEDDDY